ncbi:MULTISPECIES: stage III sporulation protein AB [Caproicibacterium]|uniref:stage III sporulation protein AB n=1 Tax=Caproicibacterium TaxID=2834348 RepID=UPI0012F86613|nr:stage III sporulation protein AB [Caproicibacterium lactatifermentans]MDD4807924.1 stage III sporulation protein AB [Oscillospiraceae bacterium]
MLRILGALCLVFAGTAAGCLQSRKLRLRRDRAQDFLQFLSAAKAEISCTAAPVQDIVEHHGRKLDFLAPYFTAIEAGEPFTQAWQKASSDSSLTPQERVLLRNFGEGFGATDMQGQLAHCTLYEELTRQELEESQKTYQKDGKLYRMLGVCGGLIFALVLL